MQIGIVGSGKMGKEIFSYLLDYDYEVILLCRKVEGVLTLKEKYEKKINKMLKRKLITLEEAEEKRQQIKVTCDLNELRACDLVIESVIENLVVKQEVFKKIEEVVSDICILATNTSSLPIRKIFEGCQKRDRCMGVHFFFPMKLNSVVEINKMKETKKEYIEFIERLMKCIKRTTLELDEGRHTILSRILTTVSAYIYAVYKEGYLSINQIEEVVKEKIMLFGTFELIDATGLEIMEQCIENFSDDRYTLLYKDIYQAIKEAGRIGKTIIGYEEKQHRILKALDDTQLETYKMNLVLKVKALILNEIMFSINKKHVDSKVIEIVQEGIGLYQSPKEMLDEIGIKTIEDVLRQEYMRRNDELFRMEPHYDMLQ